MKILLDENLPRTLKTDFGNEHQVKTVREMGWNGKKNGELMGLINANGFDIFVTIDQNLRFQQNLIKYNFSVFLLMSFSNRRENLQPLIYKIVDRIKLGEYSKLTEIS
ncbi:MAG TPA: DUF5615 family PIN-like protein [Bacteroidia bacterium]|jgi:predicted nuclease of predicted toxin-antitoxin system|nr:DUF5615 family PIN-like protein [Bacteroidia bacterium]